MEKSIADAVNNRTTAYWVSQAKNTKLAHKRIPIFHLFELPPAKKSRYSTNQKMKNSAVLKAILFYF